MARRRAGHRRIACHRAVAVPTRHAVQLEVALGARKRRADVVRQRGEVALERPARTERLAVRGAFGIEHGVEGRGQRQGVRGAEGNGHAGVRVGAARTHDGGHTVELARIACGAAGAQHGGGRSGAGKGDQGGNGPHGHADRHGAPPFCTGFQDDGAQTLPAHRTFLARRGVRVMPGACAP